MLWMILSRDHEYFLLFTFLYYIKKLRTKTQNEIDFLLCKKSQQNNLLDSSEIAILLMLDLIFFKDHDYNFMQIEI